MAIEIKPSGGGDYGYSVATLFVGKNDPLLVAAKSLGVKITHPSGELYQVFYDGVHFGSIVVKPQAITLVKQGHLGKMSKDAIKSQFVEALAKAYSASKHTDSPWFLEEEDIGIDVVGADAPKLKSLHEVLAKGLEFPKHDGGPQPVNDTLACLAQSPKAKITKLKKENPMSGNVCKLIDATELYQEVSATSNGSIYQVIIILLGAKIAARVKGNKLSLRAEGQNLQQYQEALVGFGFGGSSVSDYLSLHVNVPDEEIRKQVIGALAGRIGFSWVMEVGDICKVTGV